MISAFENFPHSSNPGQEILIRMKPSLFLFSHLFPILPHPCLSAHCITPSDL